MSRGDERGRKEDGGRERVVIADDRTWEKRGESSLLSGIKTTWAVAFPTVEGGKATYPPDGGEAGYSFGESVCALACEFAERKLDLLPRKRGGRFAGG